MLYFWIFSRFNILCYIARSLFSVGFSSYLFFPVLFSSGGSVLLSRTGFSFLVLSSFSLSLSLGVNDFGRPSVT